MARGDILIKQIEGLFAVFKAEIEIANANDNLDINRYAQNFLIELLNPIYNCSLENLDFTEKSNYPAVDLGDKTKGIA